MQIKDDRYFDMKQKEGLSVRFQCVFWMFGTYGENGATVIKCFYK
jgi:hypothetical protein